MKKILIVANWKCNPVTLSEAEKLFNSVKKSINKFKKTETVICPPFIYLDKLKANGAQDCFWQEKGAFTGEVSCLMLKKMKVDYVIIGHSERRKYFQENKQVTVKKIKAALEAGLKPILCVDRVSQIPTEFKEIIIAYEPVSAIGTGKPYGFEKAKKVREKIKFKQVLYGGSVNSENALDYVKKAGFQGLLIGGASLKAQEFVKIIEKFN
jgi:triosephosphate isomerase (TIM)